MNYSSKPLRFSYDSQWPSARAREHSQVGCAGELLSA